MWSVYVIQHSSFGEIYIGATNDLQKRLKKHNSQFNHGYSKRLDGKWRLVYVEIYRNKDDAFAREKRLKQHGSVKQGLMKRIQHSLLETKSEAGQG